MRLKSVFLGLVLAIVSTSISSAQGLNIGIGRGYYGPGISIGNGYTNRGGYYSGYGNYGYGRQYTPYSGYYGGYRAYRPNYGYGYGGGYYRAPVYGGYRNYGYRRGYRW